MAWRQTLTYLFQYMKKETYTIFMDIMLAAAVLAVCACLYQ